MNSFKWSRGLTLDKDPDAVEVYRWDFSQWLDGEVISSAQAIAEAPLVATVDSFTSTTVDVRVSGGQVGKRLGVTCRVTSSNNRVQDRTIYFRIREL